VLGKDHVEALVYVGALAPDEGGKLGELTARFPGSSWPSRPRPPRSSERSCSASHRRSQGGR
jgi:hypothetical protein